MNERLQEIKQNILQDTNGLPILVYIVAEGCHEHPAVLAEEVRTMIGVHGLDVTFYTICLNENYMPFPRPLTKVLYYFKPHHITPIMYRVDPNIVAFFSHDVNNVKRIIDGEAPDSVFYSEQQLEINKQTENMFQEEQKQSDKFPSKLSMIRSAAKQFYYSAKSAKQGLPVFVSSDIAQERYQTCEECDMFDKNTTRCKECGCFMRVKVNLANTKCPIDKWDSTI
jgi:hypothetical protein